MCAKFKFSLPESLFIELQKEVNRQRRPRSNVVADAIFDYLANLAAQRRATRRIVGAMRNKKKKS